MAGNVKWRRIFCWVCKKPFMASRETAMCCSAKCRQWRSRFAKEHGQFPTRDYAWYLYAQQHQRQVEDSPALSEKRTN